MRIRPYEHLEDFRQEVRAFIRENLPEAEARRISRATYNSFRDIGASLWWTSRLHEKGWSVPFWPVEYGGADWEPMQHFVLHEEMAMADAPTSNVQGTHLAGPMVYLYGSDFLKELILPGIREGKAAWSQGFSEPGAGSDLASLRTAARREGDRYIVKGQKIWTSGAYQADWGFFLVRTSQHEKKQQGISFLLIPMDTPGITVRQIPQINNDAHLCEVFLDDVEVPAAYMVGEEGQGWTYAKALLNLERTDSSFIFLNKREIVRLKRLIALEQPDGPVTADDHALRMRLAVVEAQVNALEWSVLRMLANEKRDYPTSAIASALKVRGSDLQQAITEIQIDVIGSKALRRYDRDTVCAGQFDLDAFWHDDVPGRTYGAIYSRSATVYGGSRQIQGNIIAKTAFGL